MGYNSFAYLIFKNLCFICFFTTQDAREAVDKMSDESDVTELQEAVEMATLDKEMAEEKVRALIGEI